MSAVQWVSSSPRVCRALASLFLAERLGLSSSLARFSVCRTISEENTRHDTEQHYRRDDAIYGKESCVDKAEVFWKHKPML